MSVSLLFRASFIRASSIDTLACSCCSALRWASSWLFRPWAASDRDRIHNSTVDFESFAYACVREHNSTVHLNSLHELVHSGPVHSLRSHKDGTQ